MLGKNNYCERLNKMKIQSKQDHFSIRKLTIGTASVLLGFTFFSVNESTVKADANNPVEEKNTIAKKQIQYQTNKEESNSDLTTFSGLSTFLKTTSSSTTNEQKPKVDNNEQVSSANSDKQESANSDNNSESGEEQNTSSSAPESNNQNHSTEELPSESKGDANDSSKSPDNAKAKKDNLIANDDKTGNQPTVVNGAAHIYNWNQFKSAYQNKNVNEIDIMQNIVATNNSNWNGFDFDGRKLIIKSYDADNKKARYTINFKGNHFNVRSNTSLDLTYENLILWSADFYGVIRTADLNSNQYANIIFKNTEFYGSQMIYTNRNTNVYFIGDNRAETIKTPYEANGPFDGNNQQLFQYTGDNNSINFMGNFIGKTYGGNVIEMSGNYNTVNIEKDATVSLYPGGNGVGRLGLSNPSETTGTIFAIALLADNELVNVKGTLNIVVGNDTYKGRYDNNQATAIYISKSNSSTFNILENATVNITTNGDIADYGWRRNLVNDGGNFNIKQKGTLNITGQNMGDYSDTLVYINGKANIENGAFNIRLKDNAGTGAITLINVQGGTLIVNNPTSLVLDAHLNTNKGTSIIGIMPISITNVRQQFDFSNLDIGMGQESLPPFHALKIRKNNQTILVDNIELLNGQRQLSSAELKNIEDRLAQANIPIEKLPIDVVNSLKTAAKNNWTYDMLFKDIIEKAFNNQQNFGYNNISFIPANPSGFMDIDANKVSVTRNEDGSQTITGEAGSLINYDSKVDGPGENHFFNLILPVGTKAYIVANLIDPNGKIIPWSAKDENNENLISNPYAETADTLRDSDNSSLDPLPTEFAAEVKEDGSFEITIPADQALKLQKGTLLELSPSANFVSYAPSDLNTKQRPISKKLDILTLSEAQDQAAQAIISAINEAKSNKPNNLTPNQEKVFVDAINQANLAASKTISAANKATSVYDPSSNTIKEVNNRKQTALDLIAKALNDAKVSSAIESSKQAAVNEITAEASKQTSNFPELTEKLNSARDSAIAQIKNTTSIEESNQAKNSGQQLIKQVIQAYKDDAKQRLNNQIEQLQKDINDIADDPNLTAPEKTEITDLINQLQRPKAIAQDQGEIDQSVDQSSVESRQKEAQNYLDNVQKKVTAIKKLKTAAKEQVDKHADYSQKIKDSLNQAIHNVITGDDPDGENGLKAINKVYSDQEAQKINIAAEKAKKRVQESGLSTEEQASYLTAIDDANRLATVLPGTNGYDANQSIYGTTDENAIKERITKVQTSFAKLASKAEVAGFAKLIEDNLGVSSTSEIEQAVALGLTNIDQATDLAASVSTAKKNILQEISKKKLNDAEASFEMQVSNITGLSANDIDDIKKQAKKLLNNDENPLGYIQRIDQATSIDAINSERSDGLKALDKLLADQVAKGQRNNQITEVTQKIRLKQEQANKNIDNISSLTAEQKEVYHKQVNDIADQGIKDLAITENTKISEVEKTVNAKIDNIVEKANGDADQVVNSARAAAKQKISDAATAAKTRIDQIPANQLSQTSKDYYKNLIADRVKEANNKIDSAKDTDAIVFAQKEGEAKINSDLTNAQLSATKSKVIKDLQDAKESAKHALNDAHDSMAISDEIWQDKLNLVDKYYNQTINAIAGDSQLADINSHATTGIKNINSVVESISPDIEAQRLEQQRQSAIKELQSITDRVRDHITNDANLSPTEKTKYYNQIAAKFNDAQSAIQAANKDNIQAALINGKAELGKLQGQADIQSAKDKALAELLEEKNSIYQKINNLDQVTSVNKEQLRKTVDLAYAEAVAKVNNPMPESIDQISAEKNQGKAKIDDVIKDLNINKIINQQKLDAYAEEAIKRIQNSNDISQDLKNQTIVNIQKARDNAKTNIETQNDLLSSNNAEKDGEKNIDLAEAQGNGLETFKKTTINQLISSANSAQDRLNDLYNKLSDEAKAETIDIFKQANDDIAQILAAAKTQVTQATNKQKVTDIFNDAINSVRDAEAKADFVAAKADAKAEIKKAADEAKGNLSDQRDRAAVTAIANQATSDIVAAKDGDAISQIKENALKNIKNIATIANSNDAEAIRKLKEEAVEALNEKLSDCLRDINNLTDLTEQQKANYQEAIKAAHSRAVTNIQGADNDNINIAKDAGLKNINDLMAEVMLHAAKNKAKADLEKVAKEAIAKDPKDEETIASERDKAKDNVEKAQDQETVNSAKNSGINTINNIVATADNAEQNANKEAAKADFEADVNKLQKQVETALANKKIGQDQYEELKNKLDQAHSDGETRITAATSRNSLDEAIAKNKAELNDISSAFSKEVNLAAALTQLQDAVDRATTVANQIAKDNPELAKKMKELIEAERSKAAQNIQTAKNGNQDVNTAINSATMDGVKALDHLAERFEQKNQIITDLKHYSQSAKTALQDQNLDSSEIAKGEQEIEKVLQQGITSIYQATETDKLTKLEGTIKQNIDNAKWPTMLLAEKNKQINAITQYIKNKGDINGITNDLSEAQKQDLQKQVEQALQKTIENIQAVSLSANAQESDFLAAKTKLVNAEKGILDNGASADFGEVGIDKIYHLAQTKNDIYQAKQNAISRLEEIKSAADKSIENSGMSLADQEKHKQELQNIFNNSKDKINNLADKKPDGSDKSLEQVVQELDEILETAAKGNQNSDGQKLPGFDEITSAAKLTGAKATAESLLKKKQTEANQIIEQSQLTQSQKLEAKKAVDNAYLKAKNEIEKQTEITEIPTDPSQLGQAIDNIIKNMSQWVITNKNNALAGVEEIAGLQTEFAKLTAQQKANPEYSTYLQELTDSIATITEMDNLQDITTAYAKGITALNKIKGMEAVNEAFDKAKTEITTNNDLSQEQKTELIQNAATHASKAKQAIDTISASLDDYMAKKTKINQTVNTAMNDIQSEVNKANDISKTIADAELVQEYDQAKKQITDQFGSKADVSVIDAVWQAQQNSIGNNYAEIQKSKLKAEKEIAKSVVDAAAGNAKNKLDNKEIKKPNGSDYTDAERQTIKQKIEQFVQTAKVKIDESVDRNSITQKRDEAIKNISGSEVTVDKADAQTAFEQEAVRLQKQIAKDLATNILTQEQYDYLKDKIEQARQNGQDKIAAATNSTELTKAKEQTQNDLTAINSVISRIEAIYQVKQNALNQLQENKKAADLAIENSGMSEADQENLKQKVQKLFDQKQQEINHIADKKADGNDKSLTEIEQEADQIIEQATKGSQSEGGQKIPGFDDYTDEANLAKAKAVAKTILQNKQKQAYQIIEKSQLTSTQKQAAKKAVDSAYANAKENIEKQSNIANIPTDQNIIGREIDNIVKNSSYWVISAKNNALTGAKGVTGLQTSLDELDERQKASPDYATYLQEIATSLKTIKQSDNIQDISTSYNKGILALSKIKGQEAVEEAANKAIAEIIHNADVDETKQQLIDAVNEQAAQAKQEIAEITSLADDSATSQAKITQKVDAVTKNIQTEVNQAINLSKNKSDQELQAKLQEAKNKIHQDFGNQSDTSAIDQVAKEHEHVIGDNYDEIQKNKIEAIKEIAKAAIKDAATNAKKKLDKNEIKKPNGANYTDEEKQRITAAIDQEKEKAENQLNQATGHKNELTGKSDIDEALNQGIESIHQNISDQVQIDKIINNGSSHSSNAEDFPESNTDLPTDNNDHNADDTVANAEEVTLMHNAYLYDYDGRRANHVILKIGSVATTYGVKSINGKQYYILIDKADNNRKYYLAVGNVKYIVQRLKKNAFVYDKYGRKVKNAKILKKGSLVTTYGDPVNIRGQKYFIIGKGKYLKAAKVNRKQNTAKTKLATTDIQMNKNSNSSVVKTIKHNAYLYDEEGIRSNKLIFKAGSVVEVVGKRQVNNRLYYLLVNGLQIAAGNIDPTRLELTHNAFIYNQYGKRVSKKALGKNTLVNTYGSPIKIKNKSYYIIAKNKFVKKANF